LDTEGPKEGFLKRGNGRRSFRFIWDCGKERTAGQDPTREEKGVGGKSLGNQAQKVVCIWGLQGIEFRLPDYFSFQGGNYVKIRVGSHL